MPISTSVVLCTFNGARHLVAQWQSLLEQSRLPDEIVVRDDASTDATATLLEILGKRASERSIRVRYTRNPRNVGYVANFQAALRDATGDVVFLCDQDDAWHPDKLAVMTREFERRPELLLVCGDARRVADAGTPLQRSLFEVLKVSSSEIQRMHAGHGFDVLLRRSLATGATVALRRTLLGDALPFPAGWVHDEWLAIIAAALGGFDCIEQQLVDYRQHGENQIGMPDRDLAAKWHDLVRPRAALIDSLILRGEGLRERLDMLGKRVPDDAHARAAENLRHLRTRRGMAGTSWRRLPRIVQETISGRYRRHASGWRSALRDMLRRD